MFRETFKVQICSYRCYNYEEEVVRNTLYCPVFSFVLQLGGRWSSFSYSTQYVKIWDSQTLHNWTRNYPVGYHWWALNILVLSFVYTNPTIEQKVLIIKHCWRPSYRFGRRNRGLDLWNGSFILVYFLSLRTSNLLLINLWCLIPTLRGFTPTAFFLTFLLDFVNLLMCIDL